MKTDWKLFLYWVFMFFYGALTGAIYVTIYLDVTHNNNFNWVLGVGSWVCSALFLYYSHLCKKRVEFNTEQRTLAVISEKLKELKE